MAILLFILSGVLIAYILSLYKYKLTKQQIFITAFLIHTAWEIWQILVESTPIHTFRGQLDVFVDTLAFMLGAVLYVYLKKL